MDFEAVYEKAHAADVWLTMRNEWHSLAEVQAADERYSAFAAFASGRVYNANARLNAHGGNDYWEAGLGRAPYRASRFHKNPASRSPARPRAQIL